MGQDRKGIRGARAEVNVLVMLAGELPPVRAGVLGLHSLVWRLLSSSACLPCRAVQPTPRLYPNLSGPTSPKPDLVPQKQAQESQMHDRAHEHPKGG